MEVTKSDKRRESKYNSQHLPVLNLQYCTVYSISSGIGVGIGIVAVTFYNVNTPPEERETWRYEGRQ